MCFIFGLISLYSFFWVVTVFVIEYLVLESLAKGRGSFPSKSIHKNLIFLPWSPCFPISGQFVLRVWTDIKFSFFQRHWIAPIKHIILYYNHHWNLRSWRPTPSVRNFQLLIDRYKRKRNMRKIAENHFVGKSFKWLTGSGGFNMFNALSIVRSFE